MIAANAPHSATPKNDPFPYQDRYFPERRIEKASNPEHWFFMPRPGYSQNIEDYQ